MDGVTVSVIFEPDVLGESGGDTMRIRKELSIFLQVGGRRGAGAKQELFSVP